MRILGYWARFNVVGWMGVLVQLAVLAILVQGLKLNYLIATVLAVEAAILHNFAWHELWTWADRGSSGCAALQKRLARFHLANGLISIAGNLLLMSVLVGRAHLPVVTANVCAILVCSTLNFVLSHYWVFRRKATR